MRCAVGKCKQNNSHRSAPSFYNFPKDAEQRKQWIKFCNRVKPINVIKDKVCGLHFRKEDFERNLKYEMGFSKRRAPKLKPGSIPCLDSNVSETHKKITQIEMPNESDSDIQIVYDNPSEININDENSNEFVTEIKTEIEDSEEYESELKTEIYVPSEFEREIKVEPEDSNEYETEIKVEPDNSNECETEIKTEFEVFVIKTLIDIPSEFETGIRTEIDFENELDSVKIKREHRNEFEEQCLKDQAPRVTDIKEDARQKYIKNLKMDIDALRKENDTLRKSQNRSDLTIKNLYGHVMKLNLEKTNLEKSLGRVFTPSQIKKLITGDKKQNFTRAEMDEAMTLYLSCPKTYRLLKKRHFLLPSERTLEKWSQGLEIATSIKKP